MIVAEDLAFAYPGAADDTLRGLSFHVAPGEIFGLLGPSGSGKSTTQRILIALERGYRGSARVFDQEMRRAGRDLYRRIGVCFELPNLYGRLTATENLEMFAALYGVETRDPRALLAEVGLEDAADQRAAAFSKGMKMRLNLCRALLHEPEALFLDEPTGGLDPARARSIRLLLRRRADAGAAIFLSTHNMTEAAEICDRVGFLVGGAMPVIDAPDALMRRYGRARVRVETAGRDGGAPETHEFDLDGLGADAGFRAVIEGGGLRAIHSQEATLEDVFVAVAGGGDPRSADAAPDP